MNTYMNIMRPTRARRSRPMLAAMAGLLSVLLAATPATTSAQAYKVIVHPDAGVAEMTSVAVSNVFLKKERALPGGVAAMPVDLPPSSSVRDAFSRTVVGRPPTAVVTFWQQQIFSGKETPPPQKGTDAAVIEFVKSTPGGIGYVSEGASTDGVKVVKIK